MPPTCESPAALANAVRGLLSDHLKSRRDKAMELVAEALGSRPRDGARGMPECWHAVHAREPQMLLREEGFTAPGERQKSGGRGHDLVDDLIELVILRGAQRALMEPGDLAAHGRAMLLSRPVRSPAGGTRRR